MKAKWLFALILMPALLVPSEADAGRTKVRKGKKKTVVVHKNRKRTTVVVHRNFPIRRALPSVYVRPARGKLLVVAPAVYLAPVVYRPVVVVRPAENRLVWQDTDTFAKVDGWSDTTFPVSERGKRLVFHVDGKVQISFAEVVFENGEGQVVDFDDKTYQNGTFSLLDFKDGRKVSHVRMVARAKSHEAAVGMFLTK